MTAAQLISKVVVLYLRKEIGSERSEEVDGTARYMLDGLNVDHIAAIASAILDDNVLRDTIDLKLPASSMVGKNLPPGILTDKPVSFFRNAGCSKPVLLIANTRPDEEQTVKEIVRVGAPELQEHPELWVEVAADGLPLTAEHKKWWEKALVGLQELRLHSLDRFGAYILRTREAIATDGQPILVALGSSLPALRIPKDSCYFNGIKEKVRGHASAWRNIYSGAAKKRACYLLKQTPTQLILGEDDLMDSFLKVKDDIPEAYHPILLAFIHMPSGWNKEAAALAECEWEGVAPLFDGLKREKFNIGQETLAFYEEREPELLNEDDRDYLILLVARKTSEAREEDKAFYESHRNELKEDRKLKSAWDRFVFGRPREVDDFVTGLALCLESLFNQESTASSNRRLRIRCDRATKKDLRDLNVDAGLYFAKRYAGLKTLLGDRVSWNVGKLFEYRSLVESWKQSNKTPLNRSTAKIALQLKFVIELEVETNTGGSQVYATQLVWKFNHGAVVSQFTEDWERLEEHPLVACRAMRDAIGTKGCFQTVDLSNVRTLLPVYDRDRGSFVPVYKKSNDITISWRHNLKEAVEQQLLSPVIAKELESLFTAFEGTYTDAVRGLGVNALADGLLLRQAEAYASLLDHICRKAKGDRNRDLLLRPLLYIGTVTVDGGGPATVVTPWHPLRMAAMAMKADLVARFLRHLLTAEQVLFGDTRLFFKDLEQDLAHPFYPEVVLGWHETTPELLACTDIVGDYSLHESPIATNDGLDDTNESPALGSSCVLDLVQRYLALHPHEQTNLSVVLYNCDCARLPQAVVDRLGSLHEDDDIRCHVVLRHNDGNRLRELYREIVEHADTDADAFSASEATQDFMAHLRIGIMADQAPPPNPKDGCPYDIVFSQDVIARRSRLEWYTENARPVELGDLVPARWSRRRPAARDDMKSVVYLCCPVQSREGWVFLTAVTSFLKGNWDENEEQRWLPARQLDFRDNVTSRIFEETHNLGNWVVNYDELLDRRQLANQGVRVIRYKQSVTQGRNLVISSKAPLGLLRSMVLGRLKDLNLGIDDQQCRELADRFIQDANDISGDIVLRAAKRGRNASELIGIVLSRYLIRKELGTDRYYGWYFLDDYADWLGQREEQIADILTLSPEIVGDTRRLAVIVAEAKYIDAANLAAKRKESQKQLRDTMKRVKEAVFGSPERLDRDLWLARLSDLILDGVQVPSNASINLSDWRRAIREGDCEIYVRGYSHVFVPTPSDAADCAAFGNVADLEDAYQEVYGRTQVRDLVLNYMRDQDPMLIRQSIDPDKQMVWSKQTYRRPTEHSESRSKRRQRQDNNGGGSTSPMNSGRNKLNGSGLDCKPSTGSQGQITDAGIHATGGPNSSWINPTIRNLINAAGDTQNTDDDQAWLKQVELRTKGALQQFQLQTKLLRAVLTPNSALLKFAGSAHLTVDQVLKRRSELLTTYGLNVISVQPEPGVVSLSIERPSRQIITIGQLWSHWNPDCTDGNQELPIGIREEDGSTLILSPCKQHAPHTLIAGSTGSGKSVLMQNIILSIVATNTPEQAIIVLVDPKQGVDYFQFEDVPHLSGGLIDNYQVALDRLRLLVQEMDDRYLKFRTARATNLEAYNRNQAHRLPAIWLIHDEFAEWMMVEEYKNEVTAAVGRLGVKARAAGIYLVFAAQRPDASVMPMQLRANLGNRLILRVDSEGTSEIALGQPGAERLLGKGHLLAKLEGSPPCYAQVPLVPREFSDQVVTMVRGNQ